MRPLAIALALVALGCAGARPIDRAREAVAMTATGAVEADRHVASHYRIAAMRANASATNHAEWAAAMESMDEVVMRVMAFRSALFALESALDAWELGEDARWLDVSGCATAALARMVDAMQSAGVPPPAALQKALGMLRGLSSRCPEGF